MRTRWRHGDLDDALLTVGALLVAAGAVALTYAAFGALVAAGAAAAIVGSGVVYAALVHAAAVDARRRRDSARGEPQDVAGIEP